MSRVVLWGLVVLGGCGRVGYSPFAGTDADTDTDVADASEKDAAQGASETMTFGEAPGTDVSGVTSDTLLDNGNPGENFGLRDYIDAGTGEAGLIRFDLTAIPAGAHVTGATLRLWLRDTPTTSGSVSLYQVLEAWEEGQQDGAPGVANWNDRLPGVPWTAAGVGPGSRATDPLYTFSPEAVTAYDAPIPASLVQDWLASPDANHGLLLTGTGYSMSFDAHPHFRSSNSVFADQKPVLKVDYVR